MPTNFDVIVVGGGAAGFFVAANLLLKFPDLKVAILEKAKKVLQKVKISGGGRCNLTHACFDPKELIRFYPRGSKELQGPFYSFQPADTINWFENQNVPLKIEEDNRVFPVSNSSQSIVDCLLNCAKNAQIFWETPLMDFQFIDNQWKVETNRGEILSKYLVFTSGSSPSIWNLLKQKGIAIVEPVPSLFTLNFQSPWHELAGISVENVTLSIEGLDIQTNGSFLITHKGCSGPVTLALSAWAARELHRKQYQCNLLIHWDKNFTIDDFKNWRKNHSKKLISNAKPVILPTRLWNFLLKLYKIPIQNWADLSDKMLQKMLNFVTQTQISIVGKNTFKEEFVTAGGVSLPQINFKTMELKSETMPNIYFAGEVLDIDAVTGGFNFQAAWTTGFLASQSILKKLTTR